MSKIVIDVDKAIDHYNEANPTKKQLDRATLADELGTGTQIFSDWKNKKTPKVVERLVKISEKTGCSINKFITNGN